MPKKFEEMRFGAVTSEAHRPVLEGILPRGTRWCVEDNPDVAETLASWQDMGLDIAIIDDDGMPHKRISENDIYKFPSTKPRGGGRPLRLVFIPGSGRQPGDAFLAKLVSVGVYDIVDPHGGEPLEQALRRMALHPSVFADAARWYGEDSLPGPDSEQRRYSKRSRPEKKQGGLLGGLLGKIAPAFVENGGDGEAAGPRDLFDGPQGLRTCPFCQAAIPADAGTCPECMSRTGFAEPADAGTGTADAPHGSGAASAAAMAARAYGRPDQTVVIGPPVRDGAEHAEPEPPVRPTAEREPGPERKGGDAEFEDIAPEPPHAPEPGPEPPRREPEPRPAEPVPRPQRQAAGPNGIPFGKRNGETTLPGRQDGARDEPGTGDPPEEREEGAGRSTEEVLREAMERIERLEALAGDKNAQLEEVVRTVRSGARTVAVAGACRHSGATAAALSLACHLARTGRNVHVTCALSDPAEYNMLSDGGWRGPAGVRIAKVGDPDLPDGADWIVYDCGPMPLAESSGVRTAYAIAETKIVTVPSDRRGLDRALETIGRMAPSERREPVWVVWAAAAPLVRALSHALSPKGAKRSPKVAAMQPDPGAYWGNGTTDWSVVPSIPRARTGNARRRDGQDGPQPVDAGRGRTASEAAHWGAWVVRGTGEILGPHRTGTPGHAELAERYGTEDGDGALYVERGSSAAAMRAVKSLSRRETAAARGAHPDEQPARAEQAEETGAAEEAPEEAPGSDAADRPAADADGAPEAAAPSGDDTGDGEE